jgi:hypothetical protein
VDINAKKITKLDTTFSPATKSTTQDQKPTRIARRDKLLTEAVEVKEAAGAEVAEVARASETGKLQDPCAISK